MTLGQRVRMRRKELGWTQEELGKKVSYEQDEISKLERGYIKDIPSQRLRTLALALDISTDWLLDLEPVA